jgi:hypothetical protein
MPDPTTGLTISPAVTATTPTDRDGILIVVTGPVRPDGAIEVTGSDSVVHARSPEFGMENRSPTSSQVYDLESNATGGTFYLYGDDGEDTFPQTADLSVVATAAEVQAAIRALWGQQVVVATGGPLGTAAVQLTFVDRLREEAVTVAVNDDSATGGSVTITEVTAGGVNTPVAGGPFTFGPLFLPADDYSADVVYAYGDDAGTSFLDAPETFTVYEYSD